MSKLLYSATMSLDGFIAGPGGDMSWLTPHLAPDPAVDDLIPQIGAILAGKRTFGGDDPHRDDPEKAGKAFGGGWSGPQVVLTHHAPADPVPGVTFADDLTKPIALAKAAAGGRYVNVLGADVARQCLAAGELDEILVFVAPVLLGDGVRLFEHPGGTNIRLEPIGKGGLWLRVLR